MKIKVVFLQSIYMLVLSIQNILKTNNVITKNKRIITICSVNRTNYVQKTLKEIDLKDISKIKKMKKKDVNKKLFLDTETNGLPITKGFNNYHHPKFLKYYNNSRLIELAYIIYDSNGNKIKEVENLIIPDNFKIENANIHGITEEKCIKNGKKIETVLTELLNDLDGVDTIIAHNTIFDIHIILSECFRNKQYSLVNKIQNTNKEDTMIIGKNIMKSEKYPKLTELYEYLHKSKFIQEHRALSDVIHCAKCYYKMF